LINHIFLLLDEIFYPSYKKVVIKTPLFIVSMPRTATTWLQNVICADHDQFTSFKLWEMLFAPSIIQKKIFLFCSEVDKYFNNPLIKRLRKWDEKLFRPYLPAHPSSLFGYEDDDLVLLHQFSNLFLIFFFPNLELYDFIMQFDQSTDERRKRRILSFYKKCVQKHMYVFGKGRIFLSKSASFSPRMRSLHQMFTGSCYMFSIRAPEDAVASTISLVIRLNKIFDTGMDSKALTERTMKICDHLYSYPLDVFMTWPEQRYFLNLYDDLTQNIEDEITKMYHHFGFTLSDKFRQVLQQEQLKSRSFKSDHKYSPEDWGFKKEELINRYKESYQNYIRFFR
jgi:omega-hydroxy-beta-dihydromenaquinone-9 sulfotransferase